VLQALRAVFAGLVSPGTRCPRCGSEDVRPSRRPFVLDAAGIHRWRCRTCDRYFLLRHSQARIEPRVSRTAAEARPAGAAPPAARPPDLKPPGGHDLEALDRDIAAIRADLFKRQ
jgi:hypothetical protein